MMEHLINSFIDKVFLDLNRCNLVTPHKRQLLVKLCVNLILSYSRDGICDTQSACRQLIISMVERHEKRRFVNDSRCSLDKYHNILYVGLKLCYDCQLDDSLCVGALLNAIFACERTFERLFAGAIFGTRASYLIVGWKSAYKNQDENIEAIMFFLKHAAKEKLEFIQANGRKRFIDVPIESCGNMSPVKLVMQLEAPDFLHRLLRFGASVCEDAKCSGLEVLLEKFKTYTNPTLYPLKMVECFKLILRAITRVQFNPKGLLERIEFAMRFSCIDRDLVPASRCSVTTPELKHLCRCVIRERLRGNYKLPDGIKELPLPEVLKKYLDLFQD